LYAYFVLFKHLRKLRHLREGIFGPPYTDTEKSCDINAMSTFYRAMHFSAKRGIAITCRLSVRLSV